MTLLTTKEIVVSEQDSEMTQEKGKTVIFPRFLTLETLNTLSASPYLLWL